jgi:hypothetical protein
VNNTADYQNLALHFMASINFPPVKEYTVYTPLYPGVVTLPSGAKWNDALDYEELKFSKPRPRDNLVYDGKMRGEIRADGFVGGSGIGDRFGFDRGDLVTYHIQTERTYNDAVLYIRYKLGEHKEVSFEASGLINTRIPFKGASGFGNQVVRIGTLKAGKHELTLTSQGGDPIELDGFVVVEANQVDQIEIKQKQWNPIPQLAAGPVRNSLLLKYDDVDSYYGLLWQYDSFEIRQ